MSAAASAKDHATPRVVVGVDGSPQSYAALRWAVEHAHRIAGRVHAVAVCSPPASASGSLAGAIMTTYATLGDDAARAEAQQRLDTALLQVPDEAVELVDHIVVGGDAATALLDAARNAELLVLGNPARGALAAVVLGSTALRCVHHADCPIVLVPAA
ncbi:MAG TPA: universal stress protein [Pseudonocardiaceae bacterium]|nr:universal stress protein [Pseudonocardiaceae bacterium]